MAAWEKLLRLLFFHSKIRFLRTDFHYSELTILHTTKNHSGNYTCVPSNSQPASVVVHIFKGGCITRSLHEKLQNKYIITPRKLEKFLSKKSLSAEKCYCEIFARRDGDGNAECFKTALRTRSGLEDIRKWCLHKSLLLKHPLVSEIKEN